jgi:tripartite-type tricarboxylate transporter receptor subunit TctC
MARFIQGVAAKNKLTAQPIIVVNKSGGAGAEGFLDVKGDKGNPHKIVITLSNLFTTPLATGVPFNWRDLTPVQMLALDQFVLWVNAESPYKTAKEYVEAVKKGLANLGRHIENVKSFGVPAVVGINHFITEYFCLQAGIRMNHIPYRGTAPAVTDLMAGNIKLMITTVASANAAIREGRVRCIAATAEGGDLPPGVAPVTTVKQQGVDYEVAIWWGLLTPKGVPEALRRTIHQACNEAVADANLARIYDAEGAKPASAPFGEFQRVLHADLERWRQVKTAANIRAE